MKNTTRLVAIVALLCFGIAAQAQPLPFGLKSQTSIQEAIRFKGAGKDHLVYEMFLLNFRDKPVVIQSWEVRIQKNGKDVFVKEMRDKELAANYAPTGGPLREPHPPILAAGGGGVLFAFLDLPDSVGPADKAVNRVTVEEIGNPASRQTLDIGDIKVSAKAAPLLAAPLQGKYWWSPNGPSNQSIHRRVVIPMQAETFSPERFATDFIQLDESGKNYTGPVDQNASYHAYGAKLLAVAPGKVVAVKDGIPENTPSAKDMAVPITLETIGGNHVILDIGNGFYAFYAHLQPGKIAVKLGDVVKTGDPIGLLGNSGNSTEPHLHFHVIDRPDPLMGQGLPYLFDNYTLWHGKVEMNAELDPIGIKVDGSSEAVKNQAYMDLQLVSFGK